MLHLNEYIFFHQTCAEETETNLNHLKLYTLLHTYCMIKSRVRTMLVVWCLFEWGKTIINYLQLNFSVRTLMKKNLIYASKTNPMRKYQFKYRNKVLFLQWQNGLQNQNYSLLRWNPRLKYIRRVWTFCESFFLLRIVETRKNKYGYTRQTWVSYFGVINCWTFP